MTVSYTADVANASNFGVFTSILLKWKGSVYKLVYKELIAFIAVYFTLNIFYRIVLTQTGYEFYRHLFESLKAYCSIQMSSIPMTFVLGFYVSLIVKRWWDQYNLLPWPDSLAIFIVGLIHGYDERGRLMRRNIMRYVLLAYVITLRRVSFRVKKRFPTIDHVIEAGLMRSDELKSMESLNEKCSVSKWWMPLVWATNIIRRAREENLIKSDPGVQTILGEISRIRHGLTSVQHYDTISVPLVYTQVVSLAVYSYFLAAIMGGQWVDPLDPKDYTTTYKLPVFTMNVTSSEDGEEGTTKQTYHGLDLYYPFFLTLQFAFYVGWLKVAETLINPFGEDDDDFELNYLIDRHVQVSYMIVDDMHHNHPELMKDVYWNQVIPTALPYTEETAHYRKDEPKGSAENKDEHEIYYAKNYPIFKTTSSQKLSGSKPAGLDIEPSSDYEAVDTNLIGWWKNKIRKSQMRRSVRSTRSTVVGRSSMNGGKIDQNGHLPIRRRISGTGIYAKLMSVASSKSRKTSQSSFDGKKLVMAEDSIRSDSDIDSDLRHIYGDAKRSMSTVNHHPSTQIMQANNCSASTADSLDVELLRNRLIHMTQLATITENSPSSTHVGSLLNSGYPTAVSLFEMVNETDETDEHPSSGRIQPDSTNANSNEALLQNGGNRAITTADRALLTTTLSGNSSESAYYPLGSEASLRPFSPRFTVEEISANYEPVLVTNRVLTPIVSRSPALPKRSPLLPKRLARMELDKLHIDAPIIEVTLPPSTTAPNEDEEEEVFEEIEPPRENDASSAFETAGTFYV